MIISFLKNVLLIIIILGASFLSGVYLQQDMKNFSNQLAIDYVKGAPVCITKKVGLEEVQVCYTIINVQMLQQFLQRMQADKLGGKGL